MWRSRPATTDKQTRVIAPVLCGAGYTVACSPPGAGPSFPLGIIRGGVRQFVLGSSGLSQRSNATGDLVFSALLSAARQAKSARRLFQPPFPFSLRASAPWVSLVGAGGGRRLSPPNRGRNIGEAATQLRSGLAEIGGNVLIQRLKELDVRGHPRLGAKTAARHGTRVRL